MTFELHAYEAILTTVKEIQNQQFEQINRIALDAIKQMSRGSLLPMELQEAVKTYKNDVSHMLGKVNSYRRVLDELIENDEDMALMNLTMLRKNPSLYRCVVLYAMHQCV